MADPLAVYLQDHRAGAQFAMGLLRSLRDEQQGEPLAEFADGLLQRIAEDCRVLDELLDQAGPAPTGPVKQFTAWAAEKLTYWKLHRYGKLHLGTLERLEILVVGITGKQALWEALRVACPARFPGIDLDKLIADAQQQRSETEAHRQQAARAVFSRDSHD